MMVRNTKKISTKSFFVIVFLLISDLLLLYFLKYKNQSLDISDFNFTSIGNAANLFFYMLLIIGWVIVFANEKISFDFKSFKYIFLFKQILLAGCFIVSSINLPFEKYYYLTQSGNRLFIGTIFSLYQFCFFVLLFFVWLNILKVKNFIVLRAVLNSSWMMLSLLIVAFIFIIVSEGNINKESFQSDNNTIAVVLGAAVWSDNKPSPTLAARVDKALKLFDSGRVKEIYLTGGNAPGELSEAQVALNYVKSKGHNTTHIYLESKTKSTNEQIQFVKNELLKNKKELNVILVSDSYHLVRTKEISDFHKIKINVVPSELPLSFENALYLKLREALALVVFWFFAL
jgi:vancomycin permeability regulator SanA